MAMTMSACQMARARTLGLASGEDIRCGGVQWLLCSTSLQADRILSVEEGHFAT
jgi:hypothetical protein